MGWIAYRPFAASVAFACALSCAAAGTVEAKDKFVALGTGSPSGTYAPVGSGICDMVNEGRATTGVRCIAYNTGGSVYNIQAITSGELEMGITRSDLAYQSYEGIDSFKAIGPNKDIRAITTLYAMPIAVIVKRDSDIKEFKDLLGKRINIGNKGSGKRPVAELILSEMGWQKGEFSAVLEMTTKQMGKAFCDGNVDILIEGLGNPSKFYEQMIGECGGKFLDVPKAVVDKIRRNFPYFAALDIPGGIYSDTPNPVGTFGFKATLVTKASLSADTAYDVTAAVFDAFEKFQEKHPSLKLADPISMVNNGIFIPLHPGAERYLRERGYLKPPSTPATVSALPAETPEKGMKTAPAATKAKDAKKAKAKKDQPMPGKPAMKDSAKEEDPATDGSKKAEPEAPVEKKEPGKDEDPSVDGAKKAAVGTVPDNKQATNQDPGAKGTSQ